METKKMKGKGLTVTAVFEAESANYGEGLGNVTALKKISRGNGESYSYISRQALRYDIVNQMAAGWEEHPLTPVVHNKVIQFHPDATIETTGGVISAENEALIMELAGFFNELIAERRAVGDHGGRDDLISVLFGETPDGDRLSDAEILAFCVLLLVAGNETTTNLISNAVDTLLDHPDQWRAVVERPALIPSLVEESLRWVSPVQGLYRNTLAPAAVAGTTIPAGAKVLVLYASANRDTAHWPDADEFRADRYPTGMQGADHLAFGNGIHLCLGSHLARLEASLLAEKLAARLGRLERTGEVVRGRNPSIRAVKHLPVTMTPR